MSEARNKIGYRDVFRQKEYLKIIPDRKKEEWWGMTYIALEPLQNATFTEVCENLAEQIMWHITQIGSFS